ncbi:MAG: hypothetical protein ACOY3X_10805 [Pseudomonadota bacterium]
MKTPFLHLARRLATATPANWFPACLQEATGYAVTSGESAAAAAVLAPREEQLRPRNLATAGALFCAPGHAPSGGLLVLPASRGDLPVTAAHNLFLQVAAQGRAWLDAALADPRLLAHIDLGATPGSVAGAAALQFLRDRHAMAVGHFLRGDIGSEPATATPAEFDATSVCVQFAGLPSGLVLWLAAVVAGEAGAGRALVFTGDDHGVHRLERQRPLHVMVH